MAGRRITTPLSFLSHDRCHEADDDHRENRSGLDACIDAGPSVMGQAINAEDPP
jgi:hypothetical protein